MLHRVAVEGELQALCMFDRLEVFLEVTIPQKEYIQHASTARPWLGQASRQIKMQGALAAYNSIRLEHAEPPSASVVFVQVM